MLARSRARFDALMANEQKMRHKDREHTFTFQLYLQTWHLSVTFVIDYQPHSIKEYIQLLVEVFLLPPAISLTWSTFNSTTSFIKSTM